MKILGDGVFLTYFFEAIVCYTTFVSFCVWAFIAWKQEQRKPSYIFVLVGFLFLAVGYSTSIGAIARYYKTVSNQSYIDFMEASSVWWNTRVYPRLLVELLICGRLLNRFVHSYLMDEDE